MTTIYKQNTSYGKNNIYNYTFSYYLIVTEKIYRGYNSILNISFCIIGPVLSIAVHKGADLLAKNFIAREVEMAPFGRPIAS